MWSVDSYSRLETETLGLVLGIHAPAGTVIALYGDLGSGKTLLTKGIAKGMGIDEPVTSPTFTIVNQYLNGRCVLNHMDIYRVNDEEELYELGIEEYFDRDSVSVVEWPEILGGILPQDAVTICFTKHMAEDGSEWRHIEIKADEQNRKWLEGAMAEYAFTGN